MRGIVQVGIGLAMLAFSGLSPADDRISSEPDPGLTPAVEPASTSDEFVPGAATEEKSSVRGEKRPVVGEATGRDSDLIQPGDLLIVELSPQRPKDSETVPSFPGYENQGPAVAPGERVYVRVGTDGYARFPVSDRRLPFAELEAVALESMLAKHLELHGKAGLTVKVTKRPIPTSLVTVQGLVAKPGVYELPANATLAEAIDAAGGVNAVASTPVQTTEVVRQPTPVTTAGTTTPVGLMVKTEYRQLTIPVEQLSAVLRHPHLDLGAAMTGQGDNEVVISPENWKTTRLCIDGVIVLVAPGTSRDSSTPLRSTQKNDVPYDVPYVEPVFPTDGSPYPKATPKPVSPKQATPPAKTPSDDLFRPL